MSNSTRSTYGSRLRSARNSLKLSQEYVADLMASTYGVLWTQATVTELENDNRKLSLHEAACVAGLLGTTLDTLAGIAGEQSYDDGYKRGRRDALLKAVDTLNGLS